MTQKEYFYEVEKIADEIFCSSSISDVAAEFETRTFELAKKCGLLSLWEKSFGELNEIFSWAAWRAKWRDMKDDEIFA